MFRNRWFILGALFVATSISTSCRSKVKAKLSEAAPVATIAGAKLLTVTPNGLFVATTDQIHRITNGVKDLLVNLGPAIGARSSSISAMAAVSDSIIASEVRETEHYPGSKSTGTKPHYWLIPQKLPSEAGELTTQATDKAVRFESRWSYKSETNLFIASDQFIYARSNRSWYRARINPQKLTFEDLYPHYEDTNTVVTPATGSSFYSFGYDYWGDRGFVTLPSGGISIVTKSKDPRFDYHVDQVVPTADSITHLWTRPNGTLGWLTEPPVHLALAVPGQKVTKISLGLAPLVDVLGVAHATRGTWLLAPTALLYVHDPDPSSQPRIDLQRVVTFTAADKPIQIAALDNDVYVLFDTGEIRRYRFTFN